MTPRHRRMILVLGILAGVGLSGTLALRAFRDNVTFYFDPSRVAAGEVKPGESVRLGGMVEKGSVVRQPDSLKVSFVVTDFKHSVLVRYDKVLPDLFSPGSGVVVQGYLNSRGVFIADQVLAKHDAKYMPPAVAKSLKEGAAAEGMTVQQAEAAQARQAALLGPHGLDASVHPASTPAAGVGSGR